MRSPLQNKRRAVNSTFFSPAPPRVFAHRGLAIDAPENTLLAFLKALSAGAGYLELDVQVSHDGVAVIAHDVDLARVAGRSVRVDQLTLAELRKVNLGEGQSFCSLAEALEAFPEARFNIDIKAEGAVNPAVDAILAAGATGRVLIASFDEHRRQSAVKQLPGVATSASSRSSLWAVITGQLGMARVAAFILRNVDAVQLPVTFKGFRVVTSRLVRTMHQAGVEVHVWTVNDEATMERLIAINVDGIVTDRADVAVKLLRTHRGRGE